MKVKIKAFGKLIESKNITQEKLVNTPKKLPKKVKEKKEK